MSTRKFGWNMDRRSQTYRLTDLSSIDRDHDEKRQLITSVQKTFSNSPKDVLCMRYDMICRAQVAGGL